MKRNNLQSALALIVICVLGLASCKKDSCVQTYTHEAYVPVYMSYEDLRKAVKSEPAQALKNPGKIYLKGNYLFVNEIDKGIHVIDNTNPTAPQNIAFIKIPGNVDLAAIGNVLYADSYIDLLALDISNPRSISVLTRIQDALPQRVYENDGYRVDNKKGVVAAWEKAMVTDTISTECNGSGGYPGWWTKDVFTSGPVAANSGAGPTVSPSQPGIGGSTARFTIAGSALYIVDDTKLHVYNIANNTSPAKASDQVIGIRIETIFPYDNHLYIGSNNAMYIYSISNPLSPAYVSQYAHVTSCDPVVVEGNYAYFTLNNLAPCNRGVNQLQVVDISNKTNPALKTTLSMTSPRGLGIDNKTLFICDGNDGLKVYDASEVMQISNRQLAHFANINAFDVIPFNKTLLMTGADGLYQYDYSNVQDIQLLSRIAVER